MFYLKNQLDRCQKEIPFEKQVVKFIVKYPLTKIIFQCAVVNLLLPDRIT
jgi:hypothetical protein